MKLTEEDFVFQYNEYHGMKPERLVMLIRSCKTIKDYEQLKQQILENQEKVIELESKLLRISSIFANYNKCGEELFPVINRLMKDYDKNKEIVERLKDEIKKDRDGEWYYVEKLQSILKGDKE